MFVVRVYGNINVHANEHIVLCQYVAMNVYLWIYGLWVYSWTNVSTWEWRAWRIGVCCCMCGEKWHVCVLVKKSVKKACKFVLQIHNDCWYFYLFKELNNGVGKNKRQLTFKNKHTHKISCTTETQQSMWINDGSPQTRKPNASQGTSLFSSFSSTVYYCYWNAEIQYSILAWISLWVFSPFGMHSFLNIVYCLYFYI